MTYLAVAIAAPTTTTALAALQRAASVADLAELRLDLMDEFDLPRLLAGRPLPVIVTCRPEREGGGWQGSESERLYVLRQAASLGADYVDLEWDSAVTAYILDRSRTRVILSRHDFRTMPANLAATAAELWSAGADIVKLVGTAHSLADTASIFRLLAAATGPTIAIAMGDYGLLTRLLAFRFRQAFLSFGTLPAGDGTAAAPAAPVQTAPGQITVDEMATLYRVHAIGRRTKVVGLVRPHANLSPALATCNGWLVRAREDAIFVPFQLGDGETLAPVVAELRSLLPLAGYLLDPPYGCAMAGEGIGNAIAIDPARGFVCHHASGYVERLRWILEQQQGKSW